MSRASEKTDTVEINGEKYGIRALSWRTLDRAAKEKQVDQAQAMRHYGKEVIQGLRSDTVAEAERRLQAEKESPEAKRQARYDAYDRGVVLSEGVTSTPYAGDVKKALDDEDEETAKTLHERILDLSLPPLDAKGKEAAEAEGKGGSGASTSS